MLITRAPAFRFLDLIISESLALLRRLRWSPGTR